MKKKLSSTALTLHCIWVVNDYAQRNMIPILQNFIKNAEEENWRKQKIHWIEQYIILEQYEIRAKARAQLT